MANTRPLKCCFSVVDGGVGNGSVGGSSVDGASVGGASGDDGHHSQESPLNERRSEETSFDTTEAASVYLSCVARRLCMVENMSMLARSVCGCVREIGGNEETQDEE